jgi:TusE/DsrC/DsvC family sulfur relay protein
MKVLDHIDVKGRAVPLDEEGYLADYHDWDEDVARTLAAREEGVGELTNEQIDMLKFIRWYYATYRNFPILNAVCKNVHQPKECIREKFLSPLIAWKVAGLPRPDEPLRSFLAAGQTPG